MGLEERRPFYEEAERIREALQQSHLPNHIQVVNDFTKNPHSRTILTVRTILTTVQTILTQII